MIPARLVQARRPRRKPRASGDDPALRVEHPHVAAVNPARAGMIRAGRRPSPLRRRKPRASGDDPESAIAAAIAAA